MQCFFFLRLFSVACSNHWPETAKPKKWRSHFDKNFQIAPVFRYQPQLTGERKQKCRNPTINCWEEKCHPVTLLCQDTEEARLFVKMPPIGSTPDKFAPYQPEMQERESRNPTMKLWTVTQYTAVTLLCQDTEDVRLFVKICSLLNWTCLVLIHNTCIHHVSSEL